MKRRDFVLPLLGLAALLTTILLRLMGGDGPTPAPSLESMPGKKEGSSPNKPGLATGEIDGINDGRIPETARELVSSVGDANLFAATARDRNGHPLEGVEFRLLSANEPSPLAGTTNKLGECSISAPPGTYHVAASHPSYGMLSADFLPSRNVIVPGAPIETVWVEAYAYGVLITGSDCIANIGSHRFDLNDPPLHRLGVESYDAIESRIQAKWGTDCHVIFPEQGHPLIRRLTVFDRDRGPCRFDIPIAKLCDFVGPTICDVRNSRFIEAMASLEVRVLDARGTIVQGGCCEIIRDKMYAGVYLMDSIETNRSVLVPPGKYRIDGVCRSFGHLASQYAVLESHQQQLVEFRFPENLYETRISVNTSVIMQLELRGQKTTTNSGSNRRYAAPIRVSSGNPATMFLPSGESSVSLTPFGPGITIPTTLTRSFSVLAQEGPQSVSLTLNDEDIPTVSTKR